MSSDRTFGALLAVYRHRQGMSQAQLAKASGVARVMLHYYERGNHLPTFTSLAAIFRALDLQHGACDELMWAALDDASEEV